MSFTVAIILESTQRAICMSLKHIPVPAFNALSTKAWAPSKEIKVCCGYNIRRTSSNPMGAVRESVMQSRHLKRRTPKRRFLRLRCGEFWLAFVPRTPKSFCGSSHLQSTRRKEQGCKRSANVAVSTSAFRVLWVSPVCRLDSFWFLKRASRGSSFYHYFLRLQNAATSLGRRSTRWTRTPWRSGSCAG